MRTVGFPFRWVQNVGQSREKEKHETLWRTLKVGQLAGVGLQLSATRRASPYRYAASARCSVSVPITITGFFAFPSFYSSFLSIYFRSGIYWQNALNVRSKCMHFMLLFLMKFFVNNKITRTRSQIKRVLVQMDVFQRRDLQAFWLRHPDAVWK